MAQVNSLLILSAAAPARARASAGLVSISRIARQQSRADRIRCIYQHAFAAGCSAPEQLVRDDPQGILGRGAAQKRAGGWREVCQVLLHVISVSPGAVIIAL